MSKIKAMDFAGKIGTQFKTLGYLISDTATGMGSFTSLLSKVGGASAIAVPAIMGVVAAVLGLAAAFKAIKEAAYEQSFEGISNSLGETNNEIAKVQEDIDKYESRLDSLTEAEQAYLDTLKMQRAELQGRADDQQKALQIAARSDLHTAITGFRGSGTYDEYGEQIESYNKAEEAFNSLVNSYKNGETETENYRKALQSYVNQYKPLINELLMAGETYDTMGEEAQELYDSLALVEDEIARLNKDLPEGEQIGNKFAENFIDIKQGADLATQAIQAYNNAVSFDYNAPIKGYQDIFKSLKEGYEAGELNRDQIKAGAQLLLTPEELASTGYDIEQMGALLGEKLTSGYAKTILSADNPLEGLAQVMQQNGGVLKLGDEIAASLTPEGGIQIESWEKFAQALGVSENMARALGSALQGVTGHTVIAAEDIRNMAEEIGDIDPSNLSEVPAKIAEIGKTSDPTLIREYLDAILEFNNLDPTDVAIDANVDDAMAKYQQLEEEKANVEANPTHVGFEVLGMDAVNSAYQEAHKPDVHNYVYFHEVHMVETVGGGGGSTTRPSDASGYGSTSLGKAATGAQHAVEGDSLVNDGTPINGSRAEIVVQNGRAFIPNQGQTGIVHLESGATVYNAKDTQDILKRSGLSEEDLYGGIKSFGSGSIAGNLPKINSSSGGGGYYSGGEDFAPQAGSEEKFLETLRRLLGYGEEDIEKEREWASGFAENNVKQLFDDWSKYLEHFYKMGVFTEEEYYKTLYNLAESYLKGREGLLEDYWRVQEKIYDYEKRDLTDIVDLEEKLNDLAKAKTQKVLVYKDGMFQYIQNTEAVAKAQRAVQGYANGTTNANGGMQLVGEHGAELRLLNQGDGIIPANLTRNLMRIGAMGINAMGGYGDSYVLTIGTLKLEKVNDVDGLFNGLKNYAVQSAAMRK